MENEVIVQAKIVRGIGKKSGKPFVRVEIPIVPNYSKTVFLEKLEQEVFEMYHSNLKKGE